VSNNPGNYRQNKKSGYVVCNFAHTPIKGTKKTQSLSLAFCI